MRYRPYQSYKPTGIDWLGDTPSHWRIDRLKRSVVSCNSGVWGDEPDGVNDIRCVRVTDFNRTALCVASTDLTWRSIPPDQRRGRVLLKGDLLIEKSGGGNQQPVGAVMCYDHCDEAVCSNFIARMTTAECFDSRYLAYLHSIYHSRVNTRSMQNEPDSESRLEAYLSECVAASHHLSSNELISSFLDRKTTSIDALLSRKQLLIELPRRSAGSHQPGCHQRT